MAGPPKSPLTVVWPGCHDALMSTVDELRATAHAQADGPGVTTDAELWVDPETWRRVVQHIGQASAILHAAARPPRTPGTRPESVTAALCPLRRS